MMALAPDRDVHPICQIKSTCHRGRSSLIHTQLILNPPPGSTPPGSRPPMSQSPIADSSGGSASSKLPLARLGTQPNSIAKQYEAASAVASTTDSTVDDLQKIIWGQRRFVIGSLLERRKSRGRRSWIGNHGWFLAELRANGTSSGDIWCCRLCDNKGMPQFFNAQSTSSAQAHLRKFGSLQSGLDAANCIRAHRVTESFQPVLSDESSVIDLQRSASTKRPAATTLIVPRAKMARIRELSVGYIVDSNLPFVTLESAYLQELFRQFDPDLCRQAPWGRTALRKELGDIFAQKKISLRKQLGKAITQIHISFDLWTSPNRLAFISIFGHYLDDRYLYCRRLLAFRRQIGSHAGENIAFTIKSVVRDWEINTKLGVSICDNASSNDSCLRNLYAALDASMTRADTEVRRMRCFGHILNLVAQSFLYGEDAASFELQSDAYGMLQRVEEDLEHWRAKGPVGKLHNIVKFIRASPQRTEAFKAHAREQEEADVYKLAEESTAELEVIQNNSTRWNSTYMMIERALLKQSELNSFTQELGLEAEASKRAPLADVLNSEDWKMLREIRHILEPIYHLTMRTQGRGTSSGHGKLWEVMTGIEFILDHLEDWKTLYEERPEPSSYPILSQTRERPPRQSRLPSRLQSCEVLSPLRLHFHTEASACLSAATSFNETALPAHSRHEYVQNEARSVSSISSMERQERANIRTSINNAWVKLNEYYTLLGQSPLFAASVILNPDLGLRWLEANWTLPEQLQWLRDAKSGIKHYFERWYSNEILTCAKSANTKAEVTAAARRPEQSKFEQWVQSRQPRLSATGCELERYYRLEPEEVKNPVQWWVDHKSAFPQLSKFALDILAIPAMSTDCERSFSLAKLTVTSQRHSLLGSTIEEIQLLKNWIREGSVTLGGLCWDDPSREHAA